MLAKFATTLISPLGTAIFLAVLALLMAAGGSRRLAVGLGAVALGWLTIWSMPTVSLWLRGQIEQQYPEVPIRELPRADAIVVLGGGIDPPASKRSPSDLRNAADRVWYGARLYKQGKAGLLVLSGGSDPDLHQFSEAMAMRELMLDLGVPAKAIILEEKSRDTRGNAEFTAALLKERKIKSVLLVTSALHMRRSLVWFSRYGVTAIPAPTDHEARPVPAWRMWIPGAEWLEGSGRAMKEIVGAALAAR